MDLSYAIINTNRRRDLLRCLASIEATHPAAIEHEVVVVDNASEDGSADAVAKRFPRVRVVERRDRASLTENFNQLLASTNGRLFMFLNEDVELLPGSTAAMVAALDADPTAAGAGAMLLDPRQRPTPCAWRLPSVGTAIAGALFLHKWLVTESGGAGTREVGWVRSAAFLGRRDAIDSVGGYDTDYVFYSEDTDLQKRLHDAGWRILHVPGALVVHHETADAERPRRVRRIVQFHRSRDLYMRKHHSSAARFACRPLWAWPYLPRAAAALVLPGEDAGLYLIHARQALLPWIGTGMG
jgi:GT2 family glycosyltransferase